MNSINKNFAAFAAVLAGALAVSCNRTDESQRQFSNAVYLDVAAYHQAQNATFKKTLVEMDKEVVVTLAYPSEEDVDVSLAVEPSLTASYNRSAGTDYAPLAESHWSLSAGKVTIAAGKTISEPVTLHFSGLSELETDVPYVCPLTITEADIVPLESSRTAYYIVKKSSAITCAASLKGNWLEFPTLDTYGPHSIPWNGLHAVTYECLVRFDSFNKHENINSVMGVEQYLLLRIGDAFFSRQQIQFDGSGVGFGKFPLSNERKNLSAGTWYHLAATCDQATGEVCIYVNGKLQSYSDTYVSSQDINLAMRALFDSGDAQYQTFHNAYQFFVGKSYDDTRDADADFAEVRVWSVARSRQELIDNMYAVDPATPGLIGYWKCNEESGDVVHDSSPLGNDAVAHTSLVWASDIEIPQDLAQ